MQEEIDMSTTTLQALAWPMLRQGRPNDQLRTAQYLLRQRGHQIVADNIFGPRTDAAVRVRRRHRRARLRTAASGA
jgi:peptidoglycan hydrolase-like protein with peptidoglycan-binding domain